MIFQGLVFHLHDKDLVPGSGFHLQVPGPRISGSTYDKVLGYQVLGQTYKISGPGSRFSHMWWIQGPEAWVPLFRYALKFVDFSLIDEKFCLNLWRQRSNDFFIFNVTIT